MGNLKQIADRRGRDRWKDVVFVGVALLLTALSIGATTSKAIGNPSEHTWSVTLVDPTTNVEISK